MLLLEAGGADKDDRIAIPAAFSQLFRTKYDWSYSTTPQAHVDGRRLEWPRGRVLGGSSSINAMLYVRGNPIDYDTWRDVHGCLGWGFADLLPYFMRRPRTTRAARPTTTGRRSAAGRGPALAARADATRSSRRPRRPACRATTTSTAPEQDGVGLFQVTQRRGRRWSAADAYLRRPDRPGLDIVTDALVTRVLVEGGRAVGVEYVRDGRRRTSVRADEVVLSGGAVNSPQLLMLLRDRSGRRPGEPRDRRGVRPAGVGGNLQDHLAAGAIWRTTRHDRPATTRDDPVRLLQWQLAGEGPLTSPVAEGCAFVRTRPELPAPDLQLHVAPVAFVDNARGEPAYRGFTIGATLGRCRQPWLG